MQKLKIDEKMIFIISWSLAGLCSIGLIAFILMDIYGNVYQPVYGDVAELTDAGKKTNLDINIDKFDSIMKKINDKSTLDHYPLSRNIFD